MTTRRRTERSAYDLVVVGGGIFGLSVAWEAGRRGRRAALIERRSIPNPTAASYGSSRKIRAAYTDPHYTLLAREALIAWREIEADLGAELYAPVGNLYYTNLETEAELAAREAVALASDAPIRILDQQQLRAEFPAFRRARHALFETEAGYLRATLCVEAIHSLAEREGVMFATGEAVEAVEPSGAELVVQTASASYQAPQVVLAGGGWSGRLFPELRPSLRQYQQGILYVHDAPAAFQVPSLPSFACFDDMFYGFPAEPGVGFKVAQHVLGQPIEDPDFDRSSVPPGFLDEAARFLRDDFGLELADYRFSYESCMYNMSPNSDLLLDFHPELRGLFFATAGSGHSFKFGSIIGQIVLDRLDGLASERWSPRFSYDAFRSAVAADRLR